MSSLIFELTDKLCRGLFLLTDLEEGVLGMDSILLTLLAEVAVGTDRAHVADATDRIGLAAIADDLFVESSILLLLLIDKVVREHTAEALVAELLDLLAHNCLNLRQLLGDEGASAIALAAGESLLVHLAAVALDAGDLSDIFVV